MAETFELPSYQATIAEITCDNEASTTGLEANISQAGAPASVWQIAKT